MEKQEMISKLIDIIGSLFSDIRGDWSDPRWECREGWEAVSHLREQLGIHTESYRHVEGRTVQQFIAAHTEQPQP